jgi:hypothetical protein
MITSLRAHCPACGRVWDGSWRRIDCGRVDFEDPLTYRCYYCPRCLVALCVPRQLSRSSWLRWVRESAWEMTRAPLVFSACELGVRVEEQALEVIARSPLLFCACERVATILAAATSRYIPVPIDIGTMECPDCGDPMTTGDRDVDPSVCPTCASRFARSICERDTRVVLVDYRALNDEDVRAVIVHFHEIAEPTGGRHSKKGFAHANSEPRGLIWDRDLDG